MTVYALDTNTLIYFFRDQGKVARNLLKVAPARIAIPAIVLFELETGIAKSSEPDKRMKQLAELLDVVRVLPFDPKAARESARIRAYLEARGESIGPMDTLIAGTALAEGATLVTRNAGEFGRVPGLRTANWY